MQKKTLKEMSPDEIKEAVTTHTKTRTAILRA